MSPPTFWYSIRQTIGRALRETGQALDRSGVKITMFATTIYDYYDEAVIYEDFLSRHRNLFPLPYSGKPLLSSNVAFIAPCSTLVGTVIVKDGASVWYGATLRADACENSQAFYTDYDQLQKQLKEIQQQQQKQQQLQEGNEEQQQQQTSQQLSVQDDKQQDDQHSSQINVLENKYESSGHLNIPSSNTLTTLSTKIVDEGFANKELREYYETVVDLNDEEKIKAYHDFHHQRVLDTIQDKVELWELDRKRYDGFRRDDNAKINTSKRFANGGAIYIGENTNVQDNAIITAHFDHCIIGTNVTIGHSAQIHSSIVGNNCLIGMGSIIQSGCYIGNDVYIGAGTVVPKNTTLEDGTLWVGHPARKVRNLTNEQKEKLIHQSTEYTILAKKHRTERLELGLGDYSTPIQTEAYVSYLNKNNNLLADDTEFVNSITSIEEYNDTMLWMGGKQIVIEEDEPKMDKIRYPFDESTTNDDSSTSLTSDSKKKKVSVKPKQQKKTKKKIVVQRKQQKLTSS